MAGLGLIALQMFLITVMGSALVYHCRLQDGNPTSAELQNNLTLIEIFLLVAHSVILTVPKSHSPTASLTI